MSKDLKNNVVIPVEIVDNLIESLEWAITSINFWKLNDKFPCNLILRVFSDYYYELRKIKFENLKNIKIKRNRK